MASCLKNLSDFSHTTIPDAARFKFGIVVAEWNIEITKPLLEGAVNALIKHQTPEEQIIIRSVPGTFELTAAAKYMAEYADVDAVICLGCVIQGETRHFDFICQGIAKGLTDLNIMYDMPFIFGVLTTDNLQQALERAGGKHGNKGEEAAITAIKMADLIRNMREI